MVQGLVPELGRVDEHGEVLLGLFLADVLDEALGAQGGLPSSSGRRAEVINGVWLSSWEKSMLMGDLPSVDHVFQGLADDLLQGEGFRSRPFKAAVISAGP